MHLRIRWQESHRSHRRRILAQAASTILFLLGILALGFCAFVFLEAKYYQATELRDFERSLAVWAPPGAVPEAAAPSRLEIPSVGISVMVHEGVGSRNLRLGAGHIPGTALPGEAGNIGIAAHRDSYFRGLRNIRLNDTILLTTLGGTYQYSVEWTRVVPADEKNLLASSGESSLTLVTCYPFYYVGSAPDRFIVRARRVGSTH